MGVLVAATKLTSQKLLVYHLLPHGKGSYLVVSKNNLALDSFGPWWYRYQRQIWFSALMAFHNWLSLRTLRIAPTLGNARY
jgi:hypothetical protein